MKKFLLLTTLLLAFILIKAQDNNIALQIMDGQSYFWCATFMGFTATDVTIEAWVKLDADEVVSDYTAVVDARYEGVGGTVQKAKALIFRPVNDMLTLGFEWEGAWSFLDEDGLNEVQKDEWQHVALVVNSTDLTATFYVNGEEGAIHSPTGPEDADYANIGAEISWDNMFVGGGHADIGRTIIGVIDEIRVWSVARTQDEIIENMTYEINPETTDDLLAYYTCNGSPGDTILYDDSGGENHAVLNFGHYDLTYAFVTPDDLIINPPRVETVDEKKLENVSIYPNPVKDILNFKGIDVTNSEVKIFNLMGQLVEESIVQNSSFDITNLNSGIYIIEINKDNQKFYTKIIKE